MCPLVLSLISLPLNFGFCFVNCRSRCVCTSESICGGAGKVFERRGGGKIRLGDDIQGSEKTGVVCGQKREEGKGLMLGEWPLLPDGCKQRRGWK